MSCKVIPTVSLLFVLLLTLAAGAAEPGLVGWWRLDEGTGSTVADSSGRGHDGSFVTGSPAWVEGRYDGALRFDGVGKVEIPDHADFHLEDAVSVALWANPEAVQPEDAKLFTKQKSTYYPYCLQYDGNSQKLYANISSASAQFNTKPTLANFPGQWAHLCLTYDGSTLILHKDGEEVARVAASGKLRQNTLSLTIGGRLNSSNTFKGMIDDVRLYSRALTQPEILQVMQGPPAGPASRPNPSSGAVDVPRDVVLNWTPTTPDMVHDVYFGIASADVTAAERSNPMDVLVGQGQDANTYDPPGLLPFSQTYYWRVDEVNTPTGMVSKGLTWSFTTEPVSYPVAPIAATASSSQSSDCGPERTMDRSGLDVSDHHSTLDTTMWISTLNGPQPAWIRYDFGGICKLHQMWVWNSNQPVEPTIGYGAKDVLVEYSTDGDTWTPLTNVSQFDRASGRADYTPNTTVDFGGVAAQYVKITIQSNWGGLLSQYSLSEVRFFQIPTRARAPQPASGQTNINPGDLTLRWRPGREAVSHQVFLSTDSNAVENGTARIDTTTENSYTLNTLDLGMTYSWRIDEVNQAASPSLWPGDVWQFSTAEYLVVDDFESYTNDSPNRLFQTWMDGVGYSADEFLPGTRPNGTGSAVGHDIWTAGPHYGKTIAETAILHGGRQSMPLYYDNTGFACSEAERSWITPQNWTPFRADTLTLYFRGVPTGFLELSPTHIVMNGTGTDIFDTADQGRFVYKQLVGDGTILARVDRLDATDPWAKAGVMIRQTLDPSSSWAYSLMSSTNGAHFQARVMALGESTSDTSMTLPAAQTALRVPAWVKLERKGSAFHAYYSVDGATWTPNVWNPQTISMASTVYIGLAVTSHVTGVVCAAGFSNVSTTGNVTGAWQSADLAVPQAAGNSPEAFYVGIRDSAGQIRAVSHPDPMVITTGEWVQWDIPLSQFGGVNLRGVTGLLIGVGNRNAPKAGGAGKVYVDEILLTRLASP